MVSSVKCDFADGSSWMTPARIPVGREQDPVRLFWAANSTASSWNLLLPTDRRHRGSASSFSSRAGSASRSYLAPTLFDGRGLMAEKSVMGRGRAERPVLLALSLLLAGCGGGDPDGRGKEMAVP
jgi:hypothetical protein